MYIDFLCRIGDVIYYRRFGQHNLILGSPATITEYLEKRPANTSDRVLSPSIVLCVPTYQIDLIQPLWGGVGVLSAKLLALCHMLLSGRIVDGPFGNTSILAR